MWKIRKTKPIGVKSLYEVYNNHESGKVEIRGRWEYPHEAQALAAKLNKEEGYDERIC